MEEHRRWEDNIKMDLKEIGVNVRSWIDSAQDRDYWYLPSAVCAIKANTRVRVTSKKTRVLMV